jgi:predicted amidophosphoribosyltransferase
LEYRNLLTTTRSIAKQALLDDEARRENVRGAFAIRRPGLGRRRGLSQWPGLSRWSGSWPGRWLRQRRNSPVDQRRIILIDDVMTTGATADEISELLFEAGAESVSLAVVAIAIRDS